MSVDYDKHKLLNNVKRQSKRLSKLLNIPLSKAQYLLAAFVYCEPSYAVLKSKIERENISGKLFYALVASDAEQHVVVRFAESYEELHSTLEESPLNDLYDSSTKELISNLFGLKS